MRPDDEALFVRRAIAGSPYRIRRPLNFGFDFGEPKASRTEGKKFIFDELWSVKTPL
jgi:hypothetical protein